MCFSGPTLDGGLKGGVGFDLVGHISLRWLRKMPVEDNNSNCCHVDVSNVLYRWIIAIKASIKKWLPLHQALRDYLDQPPEETRMWGSVLCEYWQQPTSPCGSLDESPVCPLFPVLSVCQRGRYHSGRFLLCKSTGFTRSGDKAILWVLLARLQVMHLWLNHSGSDQSVSYEEPLATAGVV